MVDPIETRPGICPGGTSTKLQTKDRTRRLRLTIAQETVQRPVFQQPPATRLPRHHVGRPVLLGRREFDAQLGPAVRHRCVDEDVKYAGRIQQPAEPGGLQAGDCLARQCDEMELHVKPCRERRTGDWLDYLGACPVEPPTTCSYPATAAPDTGAMDVLGVALTGPVFLPTAGMRWPGAR